MAPLAQNAGSFGQGDPNAILNECREIDRGIDEIERNLNQLKMLQDRSLNDADTSAGSATSRQLDNLSSETMSYYRVLTQRVREVKSSPESRQPKNAPQVGRVDRRLKEAIQNYQRVESAFRNKTQDQMARQYRIVRPDASEAEVRNAVEDASQGAQVFQQALMQSDRRGQARAVLNAVQDRQAALQKIESQMIELAQLFQDMDTLVVQQEVQVNQIEQKGEEVVENLDKGNEEIAVAVTTARKTRKKKWICLGISGTSFSSISSSPFLFTCLIIFTNAALASETVAIVIIIVIIVVVYMLVIKGGSSAATGGSNDGNNNNKRSIEGRGVAFQGDRPVSRIYGQSKIVIPGVDSEDDAEEDATRAFSIITKPRDTAQLHARKMGVNVGVPFSAGNLPQVDKRYVVTPKFEHASSGDAQTEKRYVKFGEDFNGDEAPAVKERAVSSPKHIAERFVVDKNFRDSFKGGMGGQLAQRSEEESSPAARAAAELNNRFVVDPKFRDGFKGGMGGQLAQRSEKFGEESAPAARAVAELNSRFVVDPKFRDNFKGGMGGQLSQRYVKVGEPFKGDEAVKARDVEAPNKRFVVDAKFRDSFKGGMGGQLAQRYVKVGEPYNGDD